MAYGKATSREYAEALVDLKSTVKQLGFTKEELDATKKQLSSYVPQQVFLDQFGTPQGQNLLYALYAPAVLRDYYKLDKEHRRIRFEGVTAGGVTDYIDNVMMGYQDGSGDVHDGILSVAVPNTEKKTNPYAYNPTIGNRDSECPHCKVSFWAHSAGNGNLKYQHMKGRAIKEWRATLDEAPEHIKFNITTGERVSEGGGGYDFCGGRHEIFSTTTPEGGLDMERAQTISGKSYEELKASNRIRQIERNGITEYYLTDEYLTNVEQKLVNVTGGDKSFKHFDADWIQEKDNKFYRDCRHPIDLKSPASLIRDRIKQYQPTGGTKSDRVVTIDIYKCPKDDCPGQYRDIERLTKGKDGPKVSLVQCDTCGDTFDVNKLPSDDYHYSRPWVREHRSLDVALTSGDDSGEETGSSLGDTITGGEDISLMAVEMIEIIDLLESEIDKIGRSLNIKGAESAKEIFMDYAVNDLGLKGITNKYFPNFYKLHYTECLDCGYTENEKSNPDGEMAAKYDRGLPVNLLQCPRHKTDPRHKPVVEQIIPTPEAFDEFSAFRSEQETIYEAEAPTLEKAKETEQAAEQITDVAQRRKFLGTNLVYHGRAPEVSNVPGISYLIDMENNTAQQLPTSDSRSYKGENGKITRHIYAPAARVLKAITDALRNNAKLREHYKTIADLLDDWSNHFRPHVASSRPHKHFCRS
jgi:hypothetical protein